MGYGQGHEGRSLTTTDWKMMEYSGNSVEWCHSPTHSVPGIVILTYLCKVKTKTPRGGKVTLASEEGLIRNLANRVISDGSGALDAELGHFQAAGQIISPGSSQTYLIGAANY